MAPIALTVVMLDHAAQLVESHLIERFRDWMAKRCGFGNSGSMEDEKNDAREVLSGSVDHAQIGCVAYFDRLHATLTSRTRKKSIAAQVFLDAANAFNKFAPPRYKRPVLGFWRLGLEDRQSVPSWEKEQFTTRTAINYGYRSI